MKLLKNPQLYLILIVILGFMVRLYKIDSPIADWHSWRQADTAAVARNFYKEGFNPLIPKYDDMSGVAEKPYPNPGRFRFVEFPIYNSLVYLVYLLNGGVDEKLARLVSVVFSLGSIIFVYLITTRFFADLAGLLSAFIFAFLPFNVYFSRVVLPEPTMLFFCLGMFYFLDLWIQTPRTKLLILGLMFTIGAFLIKPNVAIFYFLPLLYSYYQKERVFWPIPRRYIMLLGLGLLPTLAWRIWIQQHPEGIPASNWLFNGTHIRFRPAFFKWIVGDRFGREILGVAGTFLFTLGMLARPRLGESLLPHLLGLSMLLYLIVFATGNVQHDYYQVAIIPVLCIFTSRGFLLLFTRINFLVSRIWTIPLAVIFFVLTFYLTWGEVKGLYQINNGAIVEAGRRADQILPKEAIVIAPYNGDTSFLYQTNRPGWPVVAYPVEEMVGQFGVTHFVSVTYDDATREVMEKYTLMEQNERFVIVDLTRPNPSYKYQATKI